eukprot:5015188-Heterocapsa_arctica.AAC.1
MWKTAACRRAVTLSCHSLEEPGGLQQSGPPWRARPRRPCGEHPRTEVAARHREVACDHAIAGDACH